MATPRRAWILAALTWLLACLGVVVAAVSGQWLIVPWAGISALNGAALLLATQSAWQWRQVAERQASALATLPPWWPEDDPRADL